MTAHSNATYLFLPGQHDGPLNCDKGAILFSKVSSIAYASLVRPWVRHPSRLHGQAGY
jgi:hypothetical protein